MAITYRFVLSQRNGTVIGELTRAQARVVDRRLNGIDTATFTLAASDPLAHHLIDPDAEHLLKVYRDVDGYTFLIFHGPIVDVETVFAPGGSTLQVNAASPFWNVTHRFIGVGPNDSTATPVVYDETTDGEVGAWTRANVAADIISNLSGVGLTVHPEMPTTPGFSGTFTFKNAGELFQELSAGGITSGDGFDWRIGPIDYDAGIIGRLYIGEPHVPGDPTIVGEALFGHYRPNVVFEIGPGTRNNAVEVRQVISRQGLANAVWHVTDDASPVKFDSDATSIAARGRHEAVLRDDLTDDTYRAQLVGLHLGVRKLPRRQILITPAPEEQGANVPSPFGDFSFGDVITVRAVEAGRVVVNDQLRVYGIETTIDDNASTGQHAITVVAETT